MSIESSTTTITMPQLGETVTEGTITRWLKRVGDTLEKYEPFAEIATDKVNAEIPSPIAGQLLEILVAEGETVATGAPIAIIGSASAVSPSSPVSPTTPSTESVSSVVPSLSSPLQQVPTPPVGLPPSEQDLRLSPAVRQALRLHQLEAAQVNGTGADGRITINDIERVAATKQPPSIDQINPPALAQGSPTRIALTRARRTIAEHMVQAVRTIPHAWTMIEVDVSALVAKRHAEREELHASLGLTPTYFHYFSYAVMQTLARHPMMNARFTEDAIEVFPQIDLAFAVALEGNLVVPVVHRAEQLSFAKLAQTMAGVTTRARAGHLSITELQGGTITVNNTGANGSIASQPIINGGQAAIITMEAIVKRPIVVDHDAIAIRSMMNICCTIDHRVIDGNVVGAFLRDLRMQLMNRP